MREWSFLTNHARALLFTASHDDARLRDVAAALGVTERSAYRILHCGKRSAVSARSERCSTFWVTARRGGRLNAAMHDRPESYRRSEPGRAQSTPAWSPR